MEPMESVCAALIRIGSPTTDFGAIYRPVVTVRLMTTAAFLLLHIDNRCRAAPYLLEINIHSHI